MLARMLCVMVLGFITWICILNEVIAQAPKLSFKHISTEQGLSNSTIEAIVQDSRGFMWFGTRNGLNRYDGTRMIVFTHDAANPFSISDSYINSLFVDNKGTLWVGTNNGLNRFDEQTNQFTRYQVEEGNAQSLSANTISAIAQDKDEQIWIGTRGGGLNRLDASTGKFESIRKQNAPNRLQSNEVQCFYIDQEDRFWVGTAVGLQLFNPSTKTFQIIRLTHNEVAAPISILQIKEEKPGSLLLASNDQGILQYNHTIGNVRQFVHQQANQQSLASNLVRSILVSRSGAIWVGTINGGLNLFDAVSSIFYHYTNSPDNPTGLSQRTVSAIYEDNQGNLWVGTHRGGINLYAPKTAKFEIFRQSASSNSLSYNDVKAFCEDNIGNIWIGTDGGGLNKYNPDTRVFKHYFYQPNKANTLGSNEVLHILQDQKGIIWVSTWGGGLCRYNAESDNFTQFTFSPNNQSGEGSNYIQQAFEDSKGNFWVATYFGGLHLFDRQKGSFTRVINGRSPGNYLMGNNILSLCEDNAGNLWIGTDDGGLNCLEASTGDFKHYFHRDAKKPDLRVLTLDNNGQLWLGQLGLYKYDTDNDQFLLFTEKGALDNEFIKGIVAGSKDVLWLATANGLVKLHTKTLEMNRYNMADGLQGLEFEANAYMKASDGAIFFGGVNGFNRFYEEKIATNPFVPPVYITGFDIYNNPVKADNENGTLTADITVVEKIRLKHHQSTFSFEFAALNYTASENNQFAYQLEGWDKGWVDAGGNTAVSYTNVSPGNYVFRVKASNNDGVWNEEGAFVVLEIVPPFWATWWFKLLVAGVLLFVAYLLLSFKRKLELQKIEEQKKEEIHQEQLQFFTNISHEFRTPLSLIAGPLEKLLQDDTSTKNDALYKVMYRNTMRLMQLINELMDFRKSESGALKLAVMPGNLAVFVDELKDEFSQLAIEKNIRFSINMAETQKETWFDRQILEKIVTNLLSNAFKYTVEGGSITLEMSRTALTDLQTYTGYLAVSSDYKPLEALHIRVADTGIGITKESIGHLFERYYKISESHLGSGIGLAFVKSLTLLHKGSIQVKSERHKGTEIWVTIPCSKTDYTPLERWVNKQQVPAHIESMQPVGAVEIQESVVQEASSSNEDNIQEKAVILLVDDHPELRQFLMESLSESYVVWDANDGKEALEIMQETIPDIIISDVMMPVMDGIKLCREVKQNVETCHIPFIMLTAKNSVESQIEGAESGADFYFSKPISMQLLQLTLQNILNQKQVLKDRYQHDQHLDVKELAHHTKDRQFLETLIGLVEQHMANPDLNIDFICTQIGMSRTKLYNKIKGLTGQAMGDFIKTTRLKKAAYLITTEEASITDAMYSVGIQTQSYFTKAFKQQFGKIGLSLYAYAIQTQSYFTKAFKQQFGKTPFQYIKEYAK